MEVFPDEGDVDMLRAVGTYKEVDYPYMLMPDHVPASMVMRRIKSGSLTATCTSTP